MSQRKDSTANLESLNGAPFQVTSTGTIELTFENGVQFPTLVTAVKDMAPGTLVLGRQTIRQMAQTLGDGTVSESYLDGSVKIGDKIFLPRQEPQSGSPPASAAEQPRQAHPDFRLGPARMPAR